MDMDPNPLRDSHQDSIEEYTNLLVRLRNEINAFRPFQRFENYHDSIDSDSFYDSLNSSSFDSISKDLNEQSIAFDYKTYPITVDWAQIDNNKHYHTVFSSRGVIGVILLNCLSKHYKPNKTDENLLSQIVNTYIMRLNSSKELFDEFIAKLPNYTEMNSILFNKYYSNKELVLLKVIIDFQICYLKKYDGPLFNNLNDWLKTAIGFYYQLTKEEIQLIRNEILLPSCHLKTQIRKDIQGWLYKNKAQYIKAINNEIEVYKRYTGGLNYSQFQM